MRSLSRPVKIVVVIALFVVLYVPTTLLWGKVLPSYSRVLTTVSAWFVNVIEATDTAYLVAIEGEDFKVTARVSVGSGFKRSTFQLTGTRPTDLVSYNLSLWVAFFLASFAFVGRSARWRFLLISPVIIVLWHVCDLTIFAKNTRWILVKDLSAEYPRLIGYSFNWHWFWMWALELNRRIIDPLLPLVLWFVFCFRSFFAAPAADSSN
jgi:hypothetical protein